MNSGENSLGWKVGAKGQVRICILPLGQASRSLRSPRLFYPPASPPRGLLLRQFPGTSHLHLSVRINKQFEALVSLLNISSKRHALAVCPHEPRKLSGSSRTPEPGHTVPRLNSALSRQEAPALIAALPPWLLSLQNSLGPGLEGCWEASRAPGKMRNSSREETTTQLQVPPLHRLLGPWSGCGEGRAPLPAAVVETRERKGREERNK